MQEGHQWNLVWKTTKEKFEWRRWKLAGKPDRPASKSIADHLLRLRLGSAVVVAESKVWTAACATVAS